MKFFLPVLVLITMSFSMGCDDDAETPFNGMYEMVTQQEKSTCDATEWTDITIIDPYFKLEHTSFFGTPIVAHYDCTGETSTTCDDSIQLNDTFIMIDGKWQTYMSSSYYDNGLCHVTLSKGTLESTETGIQWTVERKVGDISVDSEEECNTDLADTHENELTCDSLKYYAADHVIPAKSNF
jgi:hypothetical protein